MQVLVSNSFTGELSPDNTLIRRDDGTVYSAADLIRMRLNKISPIDHNPNDALTEEYYKAIDEFWKSSGLVEWCKRCLRAWVARKDDIVKCPICYSYEWNTPIEKDAKGRPRTVTR